MFSQYIGVNAARVHSGVLRQHKAQALAVQHRAAAQNAFGRKARLGQRRAGKRVHGIGHHQKHAGRRAPGNFPRRVLHDRKVFQKQIAPRLVGGLVRARSHHHHVRAVDFRIAAARHPHGGQKRHAVGDIQRFPRRFFRLDIRKRDFFCHACLRQGKGATCAHLSRADDADFCHGNSSFANSMHGSVKSYLQAAHFAAMAM